MTPEVETLASLIRAKTKQAYRLAEELWRLGAALEAAVKEATDTPEGTHGEDEAADGAADVRAELAGRARAAA